MSTSRKGPVLLIGGSGVVGSQAAKALRRLHPDLPIAIGGRDLGKAEAVAAEIGRAAAVAIDLERADLGLPAKESYSAVSMFVKDETLRPLRYAQAHGIPYVDISTGAFDIGPEVALYIRAPDRAPILLGSGWLAGAATLPAIHFAREFRTVDSIAIGAILDEEDMGGPAAYADYERYTTLVPNALVRAGGKWLWIGGADAVRRFKDSEGTDVEGRAYGALDAISLGAALDAHSVRFDFAMGKSAGRRRGEPLSTETIIEIEGVQKDGRRARARHELIHPAGQAPVTGLGTALAIERLLGLAGGAAPAPGLYLPEVLIEPGYAVERFAEFGTRIRKV